MKRNTTCACYISSQFCS